MMNIDTAAERVNELVDELGRAQLDRDALYGALQELVDSQDGVAKSAVDPHAWTLAVRRRESAMHAARTVLGADEREPKDVAERVAPLDQHADRPVPDAVTPASAGRSVVVFEGDAS